MALSFIFDHLSIERRRALIDMALQHLNEAAYYRLYKLGFRPGAVIDVGAYSGDWSKMASRLFNTPFFMIEAQPKMAGDLRKLTASRPSFSFVIALLGAEERAGVPFYINATGSSIFAERSDARGSPESRSMTTLDNIAPPMLSAPLFLKLDVQGAELEILKGAARTLAKTEVIQLEVPLLNYNEGAPTSEQVISFMDQRGFAIFDISGFIRPRNEHLVQIDVIFVRKNSRLRPDHFEFNSKDV